MTHARAVLDPFFRSLGASRVGLAISGGGDSIALLRLALDCVADPSTLAAVTVDHGLRPEAAEEARFVARTCLDLGITHETLTWDGWSGEGNLQDQARRARYRLIADWAQGMGVPHVALAHTRDDQAETFVMRLARAAGVDGLSAMQTRQIGGVQFHRPLLEVSRAHLRTYLEAIGQHWVEDPSNEDTNYERIRVRQRLGDLRDIGLSSDSLTQVSVSLAQAREALDWAAHQFARDWLTMQGPDVQIDRAAFLTLPEELQRRLIVHVLRWLAASDYAPRRQPVQGMRQAALEGRRMALHGSLLTHRRGTLYFHREYASVRSITAQPGGIWDGRWCLEGPAQPQDKVAALGETGLKALPDWRALGRPAAAVMADPGVWRNDTLIAAPLSGIAAGWSINPPKGRLDCVSALLSH